MSLGFKSQFSRLIFKWIGSMKQMRCWDMKSHMIHYIHDLFCSYTPKTQRGKQDNQRERELRRQIDEEPTRRQATGRQLGESTNSRGKWQQSDEWGAKRSQETASEESNGWEPSSLDAAQNRQANVGKQVGSQLGRQMSRKLWHHHHHYRHQHNHHNHSKL